MPSLTFNGYKFSLYSSAILFLKISALAWVFWIPQQAPVDSMVSKISKGALNVSSSRGRHYIGIGKVNLFCAEGYFALSTDCPRVSREDVASKRDCTAEFSSIRTKLLFHSDLLVALSCSDGPVFGFDRQSLYSYRVSDRENMLKYLNGPFFIIFSFATFRGFLKNQCK